MEADQWTAMGPSDRGGSTLVGPFPFTTGFQEPVQSSSSRETVLFVKKRGWRIGPRDVERVTKAETKTLLSWVVKTWYDNSCFDGAPSLLHKTLG